MPSLPKAQRRPWQPQSPKRPYQAHAERTRLYDTPLWRRVRLAQLRKEPLCRQCTAKGLTVAATMVDHITPYNDGGDFWDEANHQSLCNSCHAAKSAKEGHQRRKSGAEGVGGQNPQG